MAYFQLKHSCLYCDTHFVICTLQLEQHKLDETYCPRCGAKGTCLLHQAIEDGDVEDIVPGESALSEVGKHIAAEVFDESNDVRSYSLQPEIRDWLDKGLDPDVMLA